MFVQRAEPGRRRAPAVIKSACLCLPALLMPAGPAPGAVPSKASLCAAHEKTWFEADIAGNGGSIAVCSAPDGADPIGAVRVLRRTAISAGSAEPRAVVIVQARGDARAAHFTIRRYTRPMTTYLKFEFESDDHKAVIYDSFDSGRTATHMKEIPAGAGMMPRTVELHPRTEPLALMGLEGVVRTLPFDE